ncbi:hypothetical protein MTsDn1_17740 [Alteromonas sp. MTD1]
MGCYLTKRNNPCEYTTFVVLAVDVCTAFLKQNCKSFIRPLPEYFPIGEDSNKKFGWELCPK